MDRDKLLSYLKEPYSIRCYETIGSTSDIAKAWAREGAPHGAAVFADAQTSGRGRPGHRFYSPPGGLYMSLIVDMGGAGAGQITTLAAVAVVRAVEGISGQALRLKWVNDIMYQNLKVGGILTEGIVTGDGAPKAVIGIGLNTGPANLPQDLAPNAGTIRQPGQALDLEQLAAGIMTEILEGLPLVPRHMAQYRARCLTLGQAVTFLWEGARLEGLACDVDDDGALLVTTKKGPLRLVAGAVSVKSEQAGED